MGKIISPLLLRIAASGACSWGLCRDGACPVSQGKAEAVLAMGMAEEVLRGFWEVPGESTSAELSGDPQVLP